ncbi:MAG: helicase-exonuclease AddAB subunit AddA [Clostridia bacterium]|nr:helicase-exonuclease AddAB subunit AddA [Clostridia bacterium]
MSSITWNEGQLEAIESEGTTVLVSAAAGSGKTAVLVERIIRKITRKENPCNIEDFLIVTFTRSAAAQMREKIFSALSKEIAENPDNKHLRECRFKLPFANISTIDSFCIALVRDNFNAAGVNPDFTILDSAKENILKKKALENAIEYFHTEHPDEFRYLNETLNNKKSDKATQEAIALLYKESRAHTFPGDYLDSLLTGYEDDTPLPDTEIGKHILSLTKKKIERYIDTVDKLKKIIDGESEEAKKKYSDKLVNDEIILRKILAAAESGDWDGIKSITDNPGFENNLTGPRSGTVPSVSAARKSYADAVKSHLIYFDSSVSDYEYSLSRIKPAVKTLISAVKKYDEMLFELKHEENSYSYDDILHLTADLLLEKKDGKAVRSEIAKELSSRYREIFVDEYQDVNAAQDSIFEALSDNDSNRFLVGDVKQCIYAFRNAMPQIFMSLRDENQNIKKVYLNNNYRSRKEITDTVNFIFRQIMSKEAGDVDYDEREYLYPDLPYSPDGNTKIEVGIISAGENEKEKLHNQARYVAHRILESINNKEQIVEKVNSGGDDILRNIEYSDYCILYRNKKCGKAFGEVFDELGIPYVSDNEDTFMSSPEISFLKALLRAIDNPTDDVSLASVMLSPVYGFTPDELALIRADGRRGRFYRCVVSAAENGNEKAKEFIENTAKLRRIASTRSAGEFTADIIDEIGYRAIVSKMNNPSSRLSNINSFINLADTFEQTGSKGLSAFVRFLSKLDDDDVKVPSGAASAGSDCVRMMTIHKSKGLEFPVVVLPDTERKFYFGGIYDSLVISGKYGIGMKFIDNNIRYKNILWKLCSEDKKNTQISEEVRLLYVALTRAKERIMILTTNDSAEKGLEGIIPGADTIDSAAVSGMDGYFRMIGSALLSHPDAGMLRELAGNYDYHSACDTRIDFRLIDSLPESGNSESDSLSDTDEIIPVTESSQKQKILDEIRERLSFKYPYESLNSVRAKSTASSLGIKKFDKRYFATSKPQFAMNDKLTGAQIGTATHRFMQFCNLSRARDDIESEMKALTEKGILSEKEFQSLNRDKISAFFKTPVFERLIKSEKIYREFAFNASLSVTDIYPEIDIGAADDETILIEGVVDCAFEENGKLIIIDFKTDRVSGEEELISEYRAQLETYRKCLAKVLRIPVSETLIYSFSLGRIISL